MKLIIHSLKMCEYFAPGSFVQWHADERSYVFVEALSPVSVEWRKFKERVAPGQMVIGQKFRIVNVDPEALASIRGVVFQLEEQPHNMMYPVVLKEHTEVTRQLLSLILKKNQTNMDLLLRTITLQNKSLFDTITNSNEICPVKTQTPIGHIDTRLIIINRYIRNHFTRPLTLTDLADMIQCNPIYLSNTYSKVFKISPIKHLQKLKMFKAKNLLRETDFSVGEIAIRLGYISGSQFADIFKRYYEMTPTEFRRSHYL
ncbi:AraC family transcriptional regulator [Paenibacillus periandrae]|uniref:AraC family transcriptional regulator n=1 Tax=Paenibacillus periandrae TaxID=1761741 RepID=UPI001F08D849|nr:AraC family transcriptional regulator [Paenibacillus periandrae]